jgi:hypothetical protein
MSTTRMYDVYDDKDGFLMRAPLSTIRAVWMLHDDAVKRIERETSCRFDPCQVHANGKLRLGGAYVMVQRAVGALGEERFIAREAR